MIHDKVLPIRKAFGWILCIFLIVLSADALPLSFKITGGIGWLDGGDLNKNIQGWKRYFSDRNISPYTFSFDVEEIHRSWEGGIEITYSISSRWRIGFGLDVLQGNTKGTMSSSVELEEDYFRSADDFGTIFLIENRDQSPEYRLRAIPVILTFYHAIPFSNKGNVFLGMGGGYYFGRLDYQENYQYDSDYRDDNILSGSIFRYIDQYSSSGDYTEESRTGALGLHGLAGLEWKVSERFYLVFEVIGRWVDFSDWAGDKTDSYSWDQTWGFWGTDRDLGFEEESTGGRLWMVDYQDELTGKSYPRFVFSEEEPRLASYQKVSPAKINWNGLSFRIGIKIGL